MSRTEDDDNGSSSGADDLLLALVLNQSSFEDSFKDAFVGIDRTGLKSRNGGGAYAFMPDLGGPAARINVTEAMKHSVEFFAGKRDAAGKPIWTRDQAVGIVANLYAESGLKTGSVGDGGQAYGIAQWHPDRQAAFQRQFGHSIIGSSLDEQLEFVHYELTEGKEQRAGQMLHTAQDSRTAAAYISRYYERPADQIGNMQHRATLAAGVEARIGSLASILPATPDYPALKLQHAGTIPVAANAQITVIGDSIGIGLGQGLQALGYDVSNTAVGNSGLFGTQGPNAVGKQTDVNWIDQTGQMAHTAQPGSTLIVMIGRNDVGYDPAQLQTRADQLMDNLAAAKARGVNVIVASPTFVGDRDAAGVMKVADTLQASADAHGLNYVDINTADLAAVRAADGVHFTSEGYRSLARNLVAQINTPDPSLIAATRKPGDEGHTATISVASGGGSTPSLFGRAAAAPVV